MAFIQIVEFKTSRIDELENLEREWQARTRGRNTLRRGIYGQDRDDPERYLGIFEFDSYESAMENSNLPETDEVARRIEALCDEPPVFRNLDVRITL